MRRFSKLSLALAIGAFGLWGALPVQADDVYIQVDGSVNTQAMKQIAVVPFKGEKGAEIAQIVASDLRNSGKFNPIAQDKLPAQPSSASEMNLAEWANLGIDSVIVGQVQSTESGYNIAYQLIDTLGAGKILGQGAFLITRDQLRLGAHTVSDKVFEQLTQLRGAFRTKIAYVAQRGINQYELRVSDYDGFNAFSVVQTKEPLMSPAWSPDGQQLSYVTFENKKAQLVVQDLRSGKRNVISNSKGHNGAPAFSPDGKRVAYASNKDGKLNIYVVDKNGGEPVQLTKDAGDNTEPSWSPDGKTLVFTSNRSGSPQVYQMDADGSNVRALGGRGSYNAQISADGQSVIMISGDKVIRQDLASGNREVLSSSYLDETPSLSPNGLMIIYSATKGVSKVLQLVSADGRFKANLPGSGGQFKFPAWSPYLTEK